VGRGRLLTGTLVNVGVGFQRTLSWGPFTTALRITSFTFRGSDTVNTRTDIGLFAAPDASQVEPPTPPLIPPGWTNLCDASPTASASAAEQLSRQLPFQAISSVDNNVYSDLAIVYYAPQWWLKVIFWNQTGALAQLSAYIAVEELTQEEAGLGVDIRPQPDFPIPPAPPPPTAPTPGAGESPTPTPAPPPATLPLLLPAPDPVAMPPIAVDPTDPVASSAAICS
jgi:hypothetical protein